VEVFWFGGVLESLIGSRTKGIGKLEGEEGTVRQSFEQGLSNARYCIAAVGGARWALASLDPIFFARDLFGTETEKCAGRHVDRARHATFFSR
jgi:hypothetical protein